MVNQAAGKGGHATKTAVDGRREAWYIKHKRDGRPVPAGRGHLRFGVRNAASLLRSGGGYLFSSIPSRIAAMISISNAMVSVALIGFTSLLSPEDGPASLACLILAEPAPPVNAPPQGARGRSPQNNLTASRTSQTTQTTPVGGLCLPRTPSVAALCTSNPKPPLPCRGGGACEAGDGGVLKVCASSIRTADFRHPSGRTKVRPPPLQVGEA